MRVMIQSTVTALVIIGSGRFSTLVAEVNGMTATVWPLRAIRQSSIQAANRLFAAQPVKLTDQLGLVKQISASTIKRSHPLPEFLFLGPTNVGKSSLLSELLQPKGSVLATRQKPRDYPRKSKKSGFTQTLSFYTIGSQLRLVDSPGYGFKSSSVQGQVFLNYIDSDQAVNIKRAFILVRNLPGNKTALNAQDLQVMSILHEHGLTFDIVVTKADKPIANPLELYETTKEQVASALGPTPFDMYLTSSQNRLGIDALRGAIYEASGLIEAKQR